MLPPTVSVVPVVTSKLTEVPFTIKVREVLKLEVFAKVVPPASWMFPAAFPNAASELALSLPSFTTVSPVKRWCQ